MRCFFVIFVCGCLVVNSLAIDITRCKISNNPYHKGSVSVLYALEEAKPFWNEEDAVRWQSTRKGCWTVESFYHLLSLASTEPNLLEA
ncbi:hypothetical protein BT93_L0179 [Corymbia citriodora subsp. variegata]|uniref:Uncharacterized protein n=1 Tax=Corymbia citriodora subsp. variegata TaxID=360336 RepID=A0A8T0CRQ8_CORYI|nr:hypothetical protein BT93_L0179 [Corymbia citriodora subsp. variegata]